MTRKSDAFSQFLASGAGRSSGACSGHSLCFMERAMSRGGVMLDHGRRYAATAALTTVVGLSVIPNAYGLDVGPGAETSTGLTIEFGVNNPMNVYGNGVANFTTINSGGVQNVYSGGSASGTIIYNSGYQSVYSGGSAIGTVISSGGAQYVSSAGSALGTIISGGAQHVSSAGTAIGATVSSGGVQHVSSTGTAIGATVNSGGVQYIYASGTAISTTVNSGGSLRVNPGAIANLTGSTIIKDGGTLTATGVGTTINLDGAGTTLTMERDILTPSTTLDNSFTGAGSLIKTGAGTLALVGANSYTGLTEVRGGTLRLSGAGTISDTLVLYGGATFAPGLTPLSLPRLDVRGPANWTGDMNMAGQAMNFYLSPALNANDTLLHVTDTANIAGARIGLDTSSGRPNINLGDKLILLDAAGGVTGAPVSLTVQTTSGDVYTLQVDNAQQLWAILEQLSPTGPAYERLKAYAESRAANLAFLNDGLNFLLNRFGSILTATAGQGLKFGTFGSLGGGKSRYHTGSHVDVSGLSLLAGLALGNDIPYGRITLGTFFEGGWGAYDSYNSFSTAASAKGKGDTDYYGAGLLGRYDVQEGVLSGLCVDASARLGWTRTDFRTSDIQYNGWNANFESSALYYGLHVGLGHVWHITDKASLDLAAKLLWTRQQGDSLTVHQDRVRFKDADSLRTRLGGRFVYAVNEYVTPYVGAHWEHEFDGKARATVNNRSVGTPSLRGDTGMGELGLCLKPSITLPLSFDLGVQGYAGKREGVTGSLQIRYEF